MSRLSLLMWMENGRQTAAAASKSGRDRQPDWDACYFDGMFEIQKDGRLLVTDAGEAYLQAARCGSG